LVIAIAAIVLCGWEFNVGFLKQPFPHLAAMNPLTALLFILSGVSFLLLSAKDQSNQKNLAGKILAFLVLFTALLRISTLFFDQNIPVDTILFRDRIIEDISANIDVRMAMNAAFNFILTGSALLMLNFETRQKKMPAHYIAVVIALFGLFSIVGYLYHVKAFYGVLDYIPMAIHSAICFLFLSLVILFANPDKGIMKEFTGHFSGSTVARYLIPAAIIIPVILGYLRLWVAWTGFFSVELGTALLILANIIIFLTIVWFIVVTLNKRDLQKQEAENALREREEEIKTIFNAAPDAVILIDEEGRIIKWNPKAETHLGWREDEVIGKPLSETIVPERLREILKKELKHFLKTGEDPLPGKIVETCVLTKNGREIDIALSIAASPKIEGRYLFIGFLRDITEQKQASQYARSLIEASLDPLVTISADGKITDVNEASVKVTGISREKLIGMDFSNYFTEPEKAQEGYRQVFEKGFVADYPLTIKHKNGKLTDVLYNASVYKDDKGNVLGVFAAARDITQSKKAEDELKKSNEQFFKIFDSNLVGMIISSLETLRFQYVNEIFLRYFGYTKEEVTGKTALELNLIEPESNEKVLSLLKQQGYAKDIEVLGRKKNGKIFWCLASVQIMVINDKQFALTSFLDIEERKKAEEKIKAERQLLRTLIDNIPDPIYIKDLAGCKIMANKGDMRFMEVGSEEDFIGKTDLELFPNSEAGIQANKDDMTVIESGQPVVNIAEEFIDTKGVQHWLLTSKFPLYNAEGRLTGLLGIGRDITERKKAEEKFKGLLESAPDAMVIAGEKGEIVIINHQTEVLFGYKKDELINQKVEILFPASLHKKDSKKFANYFKEPKVRSMGAGLELFAVRKDGTQFPVEISLSPLETSDGMLISAAIRDITERKRNEALIQKQKQDIRDFVNSMSTLCAKVATDGRLLMVNKIALQASGLPMEELLSTHFLDVPWWTFDAEVNSRVCNAFKKASSGIAINYDENVFVFGQVRSINFSLIPILDMDGTVEYIVAEGRDITSLKLSEAQLQVRTNQLESANKELEAFAYSVSHDLRAPLRIIDGYTEMLVSEYHDKIDEEGKRMMGVITGNARKMGLLIDDLLNFSHLGRKELIILPVKMEEMVKSVLEEQISPKQKKVEVKTNKLEPANCDSNLIRQVWVNLISNALKYSKNRKKQLIEISSFKKENELVYMVKDNGVGFDMQYAGKLFGVFQRLHKVTEFEGTGVGLALAHRIVTRHGGRMWAEAEEDKGATFYFSLSCN
jgi:PAS domain S-box-containing protein